jgi:hypothetical protein
MTYSSVDYMHRVARISFWYNNGHIGKILIAKSMVKVKLETKAFNNS